MPSHGPFLSSITHPAARTDDTPTPTIPMAQNSAARILDSGTGYGG